MASRGAEAVLKQVVVTGILAFAFGLLFGATSFYHIQSFDKAFTNYTRNRTPENEAALKVESEKLQHRRNVDSLEAGLLFFCLSNFLHSLLRRKLRLAALCLLFASSAIVAYFGVPSFPLDWQCCSYWGPGFGDGVSKAVVQISALFVWLTSAALFLLTSVIHRRRNRCAPDR